MDWNAVWQNKNPLVSALFVTIVGGLIVATAIGFFKWVSKFFTRGQEGERSGEHFERVTHRHSLAEVHAAVQSDDQQRYPYSRCSHARARHL